MWASILLLGCCVGAAQMASGKDCDGISYKYNTLGFYYGAMVCTESDVTDHILLARCTVIPEQGTFENRVLAISFIYQGYVDNSNKKGSYDIDFKHVCEFEKAQTENNCFMRANISEIINNPAQLMCRATFTADTTPPVERIAYRQEGSEHAQDGSYALSQDPMIWSTEYHEHWRPKLLVSWNSTYLLTGFPLPYAEGEPLTIACTVLNGLNYPECHVSWTLQDRTIHWEYVTTNKFTSLLTWNFSINNNRNNVLCRLYCYKSQEMYEFVIPRKVILTLRANSAQNQLSPKEHISNTSRSRNQTINQTIATPSAFSKSEYSNRTLDGVTTKTVTTKGLDPVLVWGPVTAVLMCAVFGAAVAFCWRNRRGRQPTKIIGCECAPNELVVDEQVYSVPLPRAMRQRNRSSTEVVYAELDHGAVREDGGVAFVNTDESDNYVHIIGVIRPTPPPRHILR